ncbi:hypothetical protein [Clostridium sp. C2-6-12]|uniref:hypothetical protein n=1 Tax=Clostridium sp. C2-6-12 TaxID=2698832 RepID=UPI001371D48D|nr:hypothetical protein [Clostridium sp. C2-6-12]
MEKNLLIIKLLNIITNKNIYENNKRKYSLNIFLFGSVFNTSNPNDIDILILYPRNTNYINEIFNLKNNMKLILEKELLIDIDILILSYEEEEEIDFIRCEGAINFDLINIYYNDEKI